MEAIFIVTPCHNAYETIAQTIDSVLSQNTQYHIFYHIQDGASDDNTQKLLSNYETKIQDDTELNRKITFTWDSEKDNSMYDAISIAVKKLSIPDDCFMGWINADDLLAPNCFSTLEKVAYTLPDVEWVGGIVTIQDMQGNLILQGPHGRYPRFFLRYGLCDGIHWNFLQQEGTFFKKKIFDRAKKINSKLRLAGDWDLWRRLAEITDFVETPWPMGVFRMHQNQLSQNMLEYRREMSDIIPLKTRRKYAWQASEYENFSVRVLNEVNGNICVSEKVLTHIILKQSNHLFISSEVSSYALSKMNGESSDRIDWLEIRFMEQVRQNDTMRQEYIQNLELLRQEHTQQLDAVQQSLNKLRWNLRHPFHWFFCKLHSKLCIKSQNN